MKFAFILDPLDSIRIHKDSTVAMMREAASRGHQLFVMQQGDLVWKDGMTVGFARLLVLTDQPESWYETGEAAAAPLQMFDAVLMRKDPPFDMEYVYSTYLLELAEKQGARIVNSPAGIRDHNEKLAIAGFPQFIPPTLVTRRADCIREFLAGQGDIVLKPLDGMGGAGVFRLHSADQNTSVIIETVTNHGTRTVMAQRYIPEITSGDKRIMLIDGEPVPYALARIPMAGELRGNLNAGATGVSQLLSENDCRIAAALGPVLRDRGLMLVGLDVIGDHLTEINVTSPTGMQEITRQSGVNVAGIMVDALERAVKSGKRYGGQGILS
jgi:glutathione synthase